ASSERGQIRLQRLSCVRKPDGQILDVPIEGTINDMGGSDGIRGQVVMRNNKLIWNAGVSGILSGVGSAMQQSMTTQSISPLGATSSIKSGKVFQHGAYGGANTALGKLADYYIKLADMYHPIIQVHAGSEVNIVFLKGFSLIEGQMNIEADRGKNSDNNKDEIPQQLMQTIKNSQLGQEVNMNDSGEMQ
ncbi:MAG: TraB/VirB10 family protein, partial [Gammaproteobacteria bacterium]|nr:TraB/VirB10 family protein [Gammaproteobacteria bacterium]